MKCSRLVTLMLTLALVGCASSGTGAPREGHNPNRITSEEIRTGPRSNALDLVRTLRPRWLQVRGPTTFEAGRENPIMVYVDGVRVGGPDQLRFIPVPTIESLQFLNPTEASARFGLDHVNGAILITTRVGTTPRGSDSHYQGPFDRRGGKDR